MLGSELRIEIIEAFNSMTLAISKLCDAATKESELVAWVQGSEFNHENSLYPLNARESTCQILKSLQYTQTQAPREILVCP